MIRRYESPRWRVYAFGFAPYGLAVRHWISLLYAFVPGVSVRPTGAGSASYSHCWRRVLRMALDHYGVEAVPKPESFPVDKIYVPVKRRKALKAEVVEEIAQSILEIGQQAPILVRPDEDRFVLVEGLHRLEACKALGEQAIIGLLVSAEVAHQKTLSPQDANAEAERQKMERLRKLRLEKGPRRNRTLQRELSWRRKQRLVSENARRRRSGTIPRHRQANLLAALQDQRQERYRNGSSNKSAVVAVIEAQTVAARVCRTSLGVHLICCMIPFDDHHQKDSVDGDAAAEPR
jgi:hypothetical protein